MFLATLQSVWEKELSIKGSDSFIILENFIICFFQLIFFKNLLESFLFFIYLTSFQLLFLKFPESLFFFSFFDVFVVISPLTCPLLTHLIKLCFSMLWRIGLIRTKSTCIDKISTSLHFHELILRQNCISIFGCHQFYKLYLWNVKLVTKFTCNFDIYVNDNIQNQWIPKRFLNFWREPK